MGRARLPDRAVGTGAGVSDGELSVSEVSEVLKIPENTVKTRMFYARKRLSGLLKDAGVDRGWP